MKARLLPPAEWPRLVNTELETAVGFFPPDSRVIVVEDQSQIVGCWGLPRYLHAEGIWLHPAHRAGTLRTEAGRLLIEALYQEARASGDRVVLTGADTPAVARLCRTFGGRQLPGTHWVLPIPSGGA